MSPRPRHRPVRRPRHRHRARTVSTHLARPARPDARPRGAAPGRRGSSGVANALRAALRVGPAHAVRELPRALRRRDLDDDTRSLVSARASTRTSRPSRSTTRPTFACVTHGDFRTDNLLIDARGRRGAARGASTGRRSRVASPVLDVAYFLTHEPHDVDDLRRATRTSCSSSTSSATARSYGWSSTPRRGAREFARYTLQPVVMLVAAAVSRRAHRARRPDVPLYDRPRDRAPRRRWDALGELERHAAT